MQKRSIAILSLLTVACAAFRLWRISDQCFWFDEIFSIHAAEMGWGNMISFVARDLIHPPLFYALLKLWIAVFGDGVFWVRLLPVGFSTAAVFPLWHLCRELKLNPRASLTAVAFFAVNGLLIKYAQEVRMYSLLLFLAILSMWLFARFYFRGKSFWVLVLTNVVLVYSHYFGWFVVLSEVALIAATQRIKIVRMLRMMAVTAAAFLPWALLAYRHWGAESSFAQNLGWMSRPGIRALIDLGFDAVDPFYHQQSSIDPTANLVVAIPMLLLAMGAASAFLAGSRKKEVYEKLIFLGAFVAVPVVTAFALSWVLPVSVWGSRHLLFILPPVFIVFALFLGENDLSARLKNSLQIGVLVLVTAAFAIQAYQPSARNSWCGWDELAREWASAGPSPDQLYVFEDLAAYHYWFATRKTPGHEIVLLKGIEGMPNDPAYFLPRGFSGVSVADISQVQGSEIWISFRQRRSLARDGRLEVPVTNFENLGYAVVNTRVREFAVENVYLIRMRKVTSASSEPRP